MKRYFLLAIYQIADALFTAVGLHTGMIAEANPLMAIVAHSPALLAIVKLSVALPMVAILCRLRRHPTARYGTYALLAIYSALMVWHIVILVSCYA